MGTNRNITRRTPENIRAAIALRMEGYTWAQIAAQIGITTRTLRNWRAHPQWRNEIDSQIAEIAQDGSLIAWQCLVNAARSGSVSASRTILERLDSLQPITIRHEFQPQWWWHAVQIAQQKHEEPQQ